MIERVYIFIGVSGSGKGTQLKLVSEKHEKDNKKILFLGIGNLLREISKDTSNSISRKLADGLSKGELMPSFLPIYAWSKKLIEEADDKDIIFYDGVRKRREAIIALEAIKYAGAKEVVVINLSVSEEESLKRLIKRGRADDSVEGVKKRVRWFKEEVQPSIDYFEEESAKENSIVKYHKIDGVGTVDEVFQRVSGVIF